LRISGAPVIGTAIPDQRRTQFNAATPKRKLSQRELVHAYTLLQHGNNMADFSVQFEAIHLDDRVRKITVVNIGNRLSQALNRSSELNLAGVEDYVLLFR
jgi:hypothetical protein